MAYSIQLLWVLSLKLLRNTLHNDFLRFFDISIARTDAQHDMVARLRHRVYSEELGFEPQVASGREHDRYDVRSQHCLVTHRSSGRAAACVRLIAPDEEARLALEDHCLDSLHLGYLEKLHTSRDNICEVSRLAVDPVFRRQQAVSSCPEAIQERAQFAAEERRCFGLVWLGILLAAVAAAELAGRDQLYAMMEASLPRLIRQAGVRVLQAGDFTEYHGKRAAFFVVTGDAVADLRPGLRPLYDALKRELAETRYLDRQSTVA